MTPETQIPAHAHGFEGPISLQYIFELTPTYKKTCYLLLFDVICIYLDNPLHAIA